MTDIAIRGYNARGRPVATKHGYRGELSQSGDGVPFDRAKPYLSRSISNRNGGGLYWPPYNSIKGLSVFGRGIWSQVRWSKDQAVIGPARMQYCP
jgi:hypothetical protein